MAERNDSEHRDERDLGSRSPASEEAKQQGASGQRGGPRAAQEPAQTADQVPHTSGRRGGRHQQPPEERKGFEAGEAPSEQGSQEHPSPGRIAERQQGLRGQSPSHGAHSERAEDVARGGAAPPRPREGRRDDRSET